MAKSTKSESPQDLPDTFEAAVQELEALVVQMESGQLPLEQSLTAYKRGVALTKFCQDKLAAVEQQVKVLEGDLLKNYKPNA